MYEVNRSVAPHDFDLDADSWAYDGKDVFRGERDPTYPSLNVYWLYNEDAERVGVAEHDLKDPSQFWVGWFYECPFATWFQEEGWTTTDETLWTRMPSHVYEYCMDYGITTAEKVAELCKRGPWRVMTPGAPREFPDVSKVLFVDSDCVLYSPPEGSKVWNGPPQG